MIGQKKIYIYLICRGRLVQWETVRLPIQRSGFASRLRQMILLSRREKSHYMLDPDLSNFSSAKKAQAPSTGSKSGLYTLCLHKKGNIAFKNWLYGSVGFKRWAHNHMNLLPNSTTTQHCNLLQYQLTDLTYGGVRALIGNRPRRMEGPSGDRYEDNRTG